jgi:hypothetical protein
VLQETKLLALDWGRLQSIARFYPRVAAQLCKNLTTLISERFAETAHAKAEFDDVETRETELPQSLEVANKCTGF